MKLYTILLIFSCAFTITAQSTYTSHEDSDPEAIRILEQISSDYTAHKSHKIDFNFEIELSGQAKEVQKGFLIHQEDNFVLDLDQRRIISDGVTVWLYLKEDNEVHINDADFDEDSEIMSPADIFNLHKSDKYVFALANQLIENGEAVTQIEGKPLDDDSDYSKLRLTLADENKNVKSLKIFSKDGSRYTMVISKMIADVEITDKTFYFDPKDHEGVFVEDLRF